MHWKKYLLLLPPFVFAFLIMIFELPPDKRFYAMSILILFWASYYIWVYISNRKHKKKEHPK